DFEASVGGWFAALDGADAANGAIDGSCVEKHCAISLDYGGGKYALVGDFGAPDGPLEARFTFKDEAGKITQQGAATLSPLNGPAEGLAPLAPPAAVDGAE